MLSVSRGSSVLDNRFLWLKNEPNALHVAGRRVVRDPHQGRLLQSGACSLQFGGSSSIRKPITIGSAVKQLVRQPGAAGRIREFGCAVAEVSVWCRTKAGAHRGNAEVPTQLGR
jgi:hypothetical protein